MFGSRAGESVVEVVGAFLAEDSPGPGPLVYNGKREAANVSFAAIDTINTHLRYKFAYDEQG